MRRRLGRYVSWQEGIIFEIFASLVHNEGTIEMTERRIRGLTPPWNRLQSEQKGFNWRQGDQACVHRTFKESLATKVAAVWRLKSQDLPFTMLELSVIVPVRAFAIIGLIWFIMFGLFVLTRLKWFVLTRLRFGP